VAPAFVCCQLTKRYGATTALAGVDLEVEAGELLGLLGPNGAGKSTLTKIACGLVRACSGHAEVEGAPAGSTRARSAIGYLAELFRFPDWLSADELLTLHQSLAGSDGGSRERMELLELVELDHAQATRVDAMSKGMQQRLGIAQALVGRPRLLMLDEPTSALDPVGRRIVRDLLTGVRDRGVAVVLSSHLLSEVELVCDRVAILNGGRIVAGGTPAELARPHGVEINTGSGLLSYPRAAREEVPGMVAALVAQGEEIYEVRILSSTLEDAYLEAVGAGHVPALAPAEDAA
jgi:ABC-2 type transport system ATP-binding protein